MRNALTLIGAAAILASAISIASAADNTVPGGTGVVQSTEGQANGSKDTSAKAPAGAKTGAATGNATGGTGVEGSSQGEGSQNKN